MEVLVPINSRDSARETVEYALREYPDASITVIHVTPRSGTHGMGGMYVHGPPVEAEREYTDQLFEMANGTASAHGRLLTTITAVGCPVREIVAYAEKSDTDHIVIGNCKRTGLARFLFDNVTKGVVYRSPVSVTVVK
ncbi:Nucleotide-binding protein, UspA family [Halorhabdus sp. SVX81]|uniref:universal stress protein n=1 Tax=Halorhabdus sp. SVX81 TaxID=2978283 RepID=UPI0023DC95AF|nr:universal stress protein [Halorhabdus sp. SVX81]WEL18794.1 Nucleotide-binding protein, UspA family [Halorhabdus sp. SVX81]